MDVSIEFVDGPFDVVVTAVGPGSVAELEEADRVLWSDPRWRPGVNVLYDHTGLVPSGYASGTTIRGLARMWLAQLEPAIAERTTVVRTVDDAYAWLAVETT
jgi:hypothetical protein